MDRLGGIPLQINTCCGRIPRSLIQSQSRLRIQCRSLGILSAKCAKRTRGLLVSSVSLARTISSKLVTREEREEKEEGRGEGEGRGREMEGEEGEGGGRGTERRGRGKRKGKGEGGGGGRGRWRGKGKGGRKSKRDRAALHETKRFDYDAFSSCSCLETTIGPIDVSDLNGKEVFMRFDSPIETAAEWYTDSEGGEMQLRVRNYRSSFPFVNLEPVAGNYFPLTEIASINGSLPGIDPSIHIEYVLSLMNNSFHLLPALSHSRI